MQIKRDKFVIESGARELDGTPVEPEAQSVQHIFEGSTPIGAGGADHDGIARGDAAVGSIPLQIVAHGEAQQVARSVSALCANCKYFDRAGWLKMLRDNEGAGASVSERHSINSIRAEILLRMPEPEQHVGADNDYDIEHAMKSMGLCHAMREFYKGRDGVDPGIIGVWPTSGCPAETCSPDRPFGIFEPRDAEAHKAGQQNYDAVMLRAAGKILTP